MRWLIDVAVRRPVTVAMFYCGVGLLAWAAWYNLPVDVVPESEFPEVNVTTSWPGASPESIQTLVTSPIESLAVSIPDVHKVSSRSQRGASTVTIEFVEDANLDLVRFELADRLSLLHEQLPPGVTPSELSYSVPEQLREMEQDTFFEFTLRAPRPLNDLRRLALDKVREALLGVEGVAAVQVNGGRDPHLQITLDPAKLELYGIQAREVQSAVHELNNELPVGHIELTGTAYVLRIQQILEDLEPLRRTPIRVVGGELVRLQDLGHVDFGYAAATSYRRVDGEPLVSVDLERKPGTDVLGVAAAVRRRMERLEAELPSDVTFEVITDEAADLEAELDLVGRRLTLVLILVAVLIIVLLRDLRSAPLLFTSIGAALAITVIALYHLQIPVNVLTLTGLALAFGMLVDNAVVVLENIMRYRELGTDAVTAARRGTREVITPVLASTLTTVGVFFPFVYFHGRLRNYFGPLGVAIGLALTASLLVAITLMPAAASRGWMASRIRTGSGRFPWFRRGLALGLRHPLVVLLIAAAAWYGSYRLFDENVSRGNFFGRWWGARDQLMVSLTLQSGAEASRTEASIRPFEDYVLGLDDVERVEVTVTANHAYMVVKFPPEIEVTAYPLIVKDELMSIATRYAGLQVSVYGFDQNNYWSGSGGTSWMNSRIRLFGYNYEELGRIGAEIARVAERSARVRESRVTAGGGWFRDEGGELVLRLRRDRLAEHGLTAEEVNLQLQSQLAGRTSQDRLRLGSDEWNLQIKVTGVDERTMQDVLDAPIRGAAGSPTRLGDLVDVTLQKVPGVITREDQRYDRYVQWEYRGSSKASEAYRRAIFDSLELPPGYSASLEDDFFITTDEQLQIRRVAILALVIVFMVLASLYESLIQPLVVLFAVPGALIGVFLAFYFTGEPFDAAASIGVVLLGGIVVNNAILLVDHINLRRADLPLLEAIVTGTAERVRPILITSVTTIGGMLPLLLVESEKMTTNDIWGSLALSTIGGLSASTLLTLTLTPVLYLLAERARGRARGLSRRVGRVWRALPT